MDYAHDGSGNPANESPVLSNSLLIMKKRPAHRSNLANKNLNERNKFHPDPDSRACCCEALFEPFEWGAHRCRLLDGVENISVVGILSGIYYRDGKRSHSFYRGPS